MKLKKIKLAAFASLLLFSCKSAPEDVLGPQIWPAYYQNRVNIKNLLTPQEIQAIEDKLKVSSIVTIPVTHPDLFGVKKYFSTATVDQNLASEILRLKQEVERLNGITGKN